MASYEELRSYARIIRNETKSSANTALRIGEMYLNIIDKMEDVDDRFKDFLTGTDTDTIINRWKELEAFLNGYTETTTLADLLSVKADKATTLAGYGITNAYTKTEVDNKITSVNTSVTTLQTTVSGHTTSINSLQNTVSGHTSSITSINSKITTLQGYFENGVAKSALRLSDGAEYKAWGQVFFKDGKPVNVSGSGTFTQVNADSVLFGGKARLSYDSNLNALLLTRDDGTAVHFLASGALSTRGLGEVEEGGGGTGTGVDLLNVPSDIIPNVGGTYNLGSSAKAWKTIYASSGAIGSLGLYESGVISNGYIKSINNSWLINLDGSASFSSLTINGASAATQSWVNSQGFAKISDLSAYVNAEGGTINNATLTGDVTGNGWSIEGGIANFGEVNTDSLYINGEGVLTSSSLANYVTLNSAQTISGKKTFTGGITASHLYSVEYIDSSALTIIAEEVDFTYDGDDSNILVGLINGYKPLTLGNTSFSPALTSGTVIGTITIGGESKTIFAPNGGSVDLSNYVTLDGEQTITGGKYFSDLNANSIYLQGFELKPHSLDGSTPDRLMYDGYVLLDEYNYSEYLDSAYIKKSGGTVTGQLTSTVADGTAPFVVASKTEVANLHSATATKLHTARTLWGHPFDGSSNISGSLGGVTTITGVSSSSLLIHSSGSQSIGLAYNGDGTKAVILDNSSFRPYSTANGLLNLGSTSARWKGIYGQSLGLSGGATIGGSLSIANNAPEILFYREGESSWKILNYSNGNFYIQNNYTTAVQSSYFTVLQLNRNTGNATLKGSLTTGGNILPSTSNGANIGQSDRRWLNGYIDNLYSDVISADTFVPRNSPYISVKAMSLDLYECELYGYNSDNLDVWNIDFAGNAYFLSVTQTSDVRYKNIKENIHLELSDIAAAPTFKFSWTNETDGSTHIGTSAQYWQEIAGELVVANKKTGKLGLDYSTAALVSAVSIAREVNTMKMWQTTTTDRIEELEDKVKKLEEENKALRELLNNNN